MGWKGEYGDGEMSVQSMGEIGKDFCPNILQPFLENIDRRSCNDGSRELIPVFCNPHLKGRPSPSTVTRILEYLCLGALLVCVEWEGESVDVNITSEL